MSARRDLKLGRRYFRPVPGPLSPIKRTLPLPLSGDAHCSSSREAERQRAGMLLYRRCDECGCGNPRRRRTRGLARPRRREPGNHVGSACAFEGTLETRSRLPPRLPAQSAAPGRAPRLRSRRDGCRLTARFASAHRRALIRGLGDADRGHARAGEGALPDADRAAAVLRSSR
jgi:hypothetical protein